MTFVNNLILKSLQILTILMPIQNILVLFLVSKLKLTMWISFWKEFLILFVILLMIQDISKKIAILLKDSLCKVVMLVFCLLNLSILSSSFLLNKISFNQFGFGFRFEIFWLWLLVVSFIWLRLNSFSDLPLVKLLYKQLSKSILLGFGLCSIFSTGALILGNNFLSLFGYSTIETNSNTVGFSPLCHSIDFGIDACRLSAPFSTPNHLAGYLLMILGFLLFNLYNNWQSFGNSFRSQIFYNAQRFETQSFLFLSSMCLFLIFQTYSRFAIIGVILFTVTISLLYCQKKYLFINRFYPILCFCLFFVVTVSSILITSFDPSLTNFLPMAIAKPSSSLEHYRLTGVNIDIIKQEPRVLYTGFGIGTSGPSAKYSPKGEEPKLVKDFGNLSYKWFIAKDRIIIPENWYLQLILNGGLIYLLLYLFTIFIPIFDFVEYIKKRDSSIILAVAFVSIIIGNLFLHLWENQTIVIYWSIISLWLQSRKIILNN